jgi:hypothetical protein
MPPVPGETLDATPSVVHWPAKSMLSSFLGRAQLSVSPPWLKRGGVSLPHHFDPPMKSNAGRGQRRANQKGQQTSPQDHSDAENGYWSLRSSRRPVFEIRGPGVCSENLLRNPLKTCYAIL